jgi:monoamine oxidase
MNVKLTCSQLPSHDTNFLGGGLGGLGAAIKIALVGHKVTVLEAVPQFSEVCPSSYTPDSSWRRNSDFS